MIRDKEFQIRRIEESDLEWLKELRESPETNKYLGTFCLLNSALQKKWFDSLLNDSKRCYMAFERTSNDRVELIGLIRITDIDYINRSICVGGDLIQEFRGKGYAKKMYKLIFKYGFDYLNMHRLYLYVLNDNIVAKTLYKKLGFTLEGILRDAIFSEGRYKNYELMSILDNEYKNLEI